MTEKNDNLFYSLGYKSLYELAQNTTRTPRKGPAQQRPEKAKATTKRAASNLSVEAHLLAGDIVQNPEWIYRDRIKRIGVHARKMKKAKHELLNQALIKELWLGRPLFLMPLRNLYEMLGYTCPYKRSVSQEHAFAVVLTKRLVGKLVLVESVETEVSLGDANSTIDALATLKDGKRIAYEVTLSASNICANAAKLQGKGLSEIVFVCRDYDLKETVWARLRNGGLDPGLFTRIRCTIFSSLIRKVKKQRLHNNG